eukprot:2867952-Rhodomonas_salina.1
MDLPSWSWVPCGAPPRFPLWAPGWSLRRMRRGGKCDSESKLRWTQALVPESSGAGTGCLGTQCQ